MLADSSAVPVCSGENILTLSVLYAVHSGEQPSLVNARVGKRPRRRNSAKHGMICGRSILTRIYQNRKSAIPLIQKRSVARLFSISKFRKPDS